MPSTEERIKSQFARFFAENDWPLFKRIADYYFRQAASLKKRDIDIDPQLQLLMRNVQKRLFIGIGTELLLKAYYLQNGFVINRPIYRREMNGFPYRHVDVKDANFRNDDTHSINELIQSLHRVGKLVSLKTIVDGLRIAKVFRNKEGHVVVAQHKFDAEDYRLIEAALTTFYWEGFGEQLTVRFSLEPDDNAEWKIA